VIHQRAFGDRRCCIQAPAVVRAGDRFRLGGTFRTASAFATKDCPPRRGARSLCHEGTRARVSGLTIAFADRLTDRQPAARLPFYRSSSRSGMSA
jgi:hypothetical protein